MSGVSTPLIFVDRSCVTDLSQESVERAFPCSCQHVVAARGTPQIRLFKAEMVSAWARIILALNEVVDDLETGLLALLGCHCLRAWRGEALSKIFEKRFGVVPLFALRALYSRSERSPLVTLILRLFQEASQKVSFFLDHGDFDIFLLWSLAVKEVLRVAKKDVYFCPCDTKDVSSVFIYVSLKVQNLFWSSQESCLDSFGLCVFLEGFLVLI